MCSWVENLCIICSEEGNTGVVRNEDFVKALNIYWTGIGVDVKPEQNKEFLLCLPCYDNLLHLYQINDVLICFEMKAREVRRNILHRNIQGVVSRQGKGVRLHKFQEEIMKEWSTKLEPLKAGEDPKAQAIMESFEVTFKREEMNRNENGKSIGKKPEGNNGNNPGVKKKGATKRPAGPREKEEDSNNEDDTGSKKSSDEEEEDTAGGGGGRHRPATRARRTNPVNRSPSEGQECRICLDSFPSSHYAKHVRQHKVGENEGKYECFHCYKNFDRKPRLIEHKKNCQPLDISD